MKAEELRQKDLNELEQLLSEQLKQKCQLAMQHGSGQLSKTNLLKKNRQDIARLYTVIGELKQRSSS